MKSNEERARDLCTRLVASFQKTLSVEADENAGIIVKIRTDKVQFDMIEKALNERFDKKYCPCGGTILADTDDCKVPVCIECAIEISNSYLPKDQNYSDGFIAGQAVMKGDLK